MTSLGWTLPFKLPIVFSIAIGLLAFALVGQAQAQTAGPTVTTVAVTSDPGSDGGYAIGDDIEVGLTFSQAVTVTGTPQLTLDVGGQDRQASYSGGGSSTTTLVFSYSVAAGDEDMDGIAVVANGLALNGGAISAGATNAALTHAALQANDHKVDGIAPTVTVGGETRTYVPPDRQFSVVFYFSEKVYGLTDSDITVTNGTAHDVRAPTPYGDATWSRYTRWDAVVEPASEGPVTVSLQAGAANDTYGNTSSAPDMALSVIAADPVAVAVTRVTSGFAEGGTAEFMVTRSRDNGVLPVSLSLDQTGDLLSGTVKVYPPPDPANLNTPVTPQELSFTQTPFTLNVTFAEGETSKRISVPTEDDRWVEADGTATLSVPLKSDQYKYIPAFADSATSEVRDNDVLPVVSAYWSRPFHPYTTAQLNTGREGSSIGIAYLRSADNGPLTVSLRITDPAGLLDLNSQQSYGYQVENDGTLSLDFPEGSRYQSIIIPVRDDDTIGAGGSVTIAILADDEGQYEANSTRGSITIPIADNDSPLTVTLDAPAEVVEGEQVLYTLTRVWDVSGNLDDLTVNLRLHQNGDYLAWPQGTAPDANGLVDIPITFANRALTTTLALNTEDDEVSEVNGQLTAQLLASSDNSYTAGSTSTQTTVLRDNEAPAISVEAVADEITEGANAQYRITRVGDSTATTTVGLYVTGMPKIMTDATEAIVLTSDREDPSDRLPLYGTWVDYILEFAAGETEKTFSLTTEGDGVNEGDGWLAVSILNRRSAPHTVRNGRAQVHIRDDDLPTVSLSQPVGPTGLTLSSDGTTWEGEIQEGTEFTYNITCTGVTEFSTERGERLAPVSQRVLYANHPAFYGEVSQDALGNNTAGYLPVGVECQSQPASYSGRRLYVGPDNGTLEIDLVPHDDLIPVAGVDGYYRTALLAEFRRQYDAALMEAEAAGTLITGSNIFYLTRIGSVPLNLYCGSTQPTYCPKYNIGTVSKIRLTVINRDPVVLIKAESPSVTEGQPARFILERLWATDLLTSSPPLSQTVVYLQASQDGQFVTGSLPTQITFGQNETRKVVEIPTVDDSAFTADGSVTIEILPDTSSGSVNLQGKYSKWQNWVGHTPVGGRSDRTTVAITNDDEKPGLTIAPARADEGDSGSTVMTFTVTLGSTVDSAVQVNWATSDGTATAGQDYTAANGSVTIPANSLSGDFTVSVTGDTLDEPDETFNVTISLPEPAPGLNQDAGSGPPVGIVGGDTATAPGTIADDDPVVVTVVHKTATVSEGDDAIFVLTRTGYIDPALTMSVRLRRPGRVETLSATFDAGATTTEVSVQTDDNALVDNPPRHRYTVQVMGDGDISEREDEVYTPGTPSEATVTAEDNDEFQIMTVHAINPFPKEGEGIVFEFRRTGDISQSLRFWYNRSIRAHGRPDDEWPRLEAEFKANQATLREYFNPFQDDNEVGEYFPYTFIIKIFGDGHYYGVHRVWKAGDPNIATFVLYDDDGPRQFLLGADFPNSAQVGQTVNIDFTVLNNNSASTSENIVVSSTWERDGSPEPRVGCNISGPLATGETGTCRASFMMTQADLAIQRFDVDSRASDGNITSNPIDIDIRVLGGVTIGFSTTTRLSVTEPAHGEANAKAVLPVTRVGEPGEEVHVAYTIEPTFAVNRIYPPVEGLDYEDNSATPGTLTFAANETPKNITIDILGDEIDEPSELFKVTLVAPRGVLVEDQYRERTVAIVNRGPPPGGSYLPTATLEIVGADPTPESAGSVDFAIVLTREWGQNARFEVELDAHDNLTATPSNLALGVRGDFDPPKGIIHATIPAGQTRFEFSIVLHDDDVREEDETFQMLLGTSIERSLRLVSTNNTDRIALATIADDDFIPPTGVDLSLTRNGRVFESIDESTSRRDITVTASFPDIRWPTDASDAPLRPADPRDVDTTVRVAFDDAGSTASLTDIDRFQVQDSQSRFREVEHFDIVIPAGQTSATTTLRFRAANDDVDEEDETVVLQGTEVVSTDTDDLLPISPVSITIRDDDTRGITIAPALVEGRALMYLDENSSSSYSLVLDSEPTEAVTITPARDDTRAGNSEFISVEPTALTFTPSNWNEPQEITVSALEDGNASSPSTLAFVTHSVSTTGDYTGEAVSDIYVFITDTTLGIVSTEDARALESDGNVEFTVSISPVLTSHSVPLEYLVFADTATAGEDYVSGGASQISIPAGAASIPIRIPIIDNDVYGPAEKTFFLFLQIRQSASPKAQFAGGSLTIRVTGTIVDDDPEPVVSVSGPSGRVSYVYESATDPVTFTLTLAGRSASDVTVDYATGETGLLSGFAARQGISRATSGEDYTDAQGTLTFSPGATTTTKQVTVQLTDDDVSEDIEYFGFKISNAQNAQLRNDLDEEVADVGLVDDDLRGLTIDPISLALEEPGSGETAVASNYTVKLNSKPTDAVTVTIGGASPAISLSGDGLSANALTFTTENWGTAQTVTVTPVKDANAINESIALTHTPAGGDYSVILGDSVTVNLADSDTQNIVLSRTSVTVTEENATGTSYTVELATQPSATVTVTISGHGGTPISLSGSNLNGNALTFTTTNWNTQQTVTVKAAHDDNAVDENVTLTHTASGGDYAGISNDIEVAVTDDDPEVTVSFGQSSYSVDEGATGTVAVSLSADPERTVIIPITTTNQGGVTAADYSGVPATVTFSSGQTSRSFTFSATQDTFDDDSESVLLGFGNMPETGVTAGSPNQTTVNITDDDTSGIVFSPTRITVTEEDATGTSYTVKLATQPAGDVTVTISGHGGTTLSLSGDTLTFTTTNWNTTQSVTVTAARDDNAVNELLSLTHTASGGGYDGVSNDLPVTVSDDDPQVTVSFGQSSYSVNEGNSVDVTVNISADPQRTVTIPITITNHGGASSSDYSGVPATVTFNSGDTSKTFTFSATQDTFDDDSESVLLGFGNMPEAGVAAGSPNQTAVNITDDDAAGIVFSPTRITVTEEDATGTSYTVKLASQPSAGVTVTISGHSGTTLSLSGSNLNGNTLTFTTTNWNTQQTVTVKAAHDDNAVDENVTLTHTASGGDYAGISNDIDVAVTDDDPQVTVSFGQSSYSVDEGATSTVAVSLSADPERTVTIPITTTNQGGASSSDYSGVPATVTFNSGDTSKTFTFSATDDNDDDDSESVVLGFGTMPEDGVTAGSPNQTTVNITDDDTSGIVFAPTRLRVTEEATMSSYTVELATQPSATVTVTITGHGGTALSLSGSNLNGNALTFTTTNWNTQQAVMATAAHDDNSVDEVLSLTHTASGGDYAGVSRDLRVTIFDDDPEVTVSFGQSSYSVDEGATGTVAVSLSADPERTVIIPITTTNQGGVTAADYSGVPATVTFSSGQTSRSFTFSATQDTFDDDSESVLLGFGNMPETGVTAGSPNQTTVNITDDDTSGIVFSPTRITVTEDSATGTSYTVKLASQPSADVTVTISGHGGTPVSLSGSNLNGNTLTFTTTNWNTQQTVTVKAAHDDNAVDENITLTHTASGGDYNGVSNDIDVAVTDDDTSGIVFAPTRLRVTEEATMSSYTVELATQPSATVTVTITGHGGTALSLSGSNLNGNALTFTTTNWNTQQAVMATAAHDDNSVDEVLSLTHTASGGDYAGVSRDLRVTIFDDDPEVTVSFGQSSYSVDEGATGTVAVSLSADPQRTVTIPITITNQGGASAADYSGVPATVTFNSGDTSKTFTFSATQDTFDDDSESVLLGFGNMPETGVTAGSPNQTTVNITDDDTSGIVFSPTRITVTEEDATGTSYSVKLGSQPTANVTVTISGHDGTTLSLSGSNLNGNALTFTTTNWNTQQTVTVTAARDDNAVNELLSLTHTASGGGYNGVSNDLPVTVSDDDPQVTVSFGQSSYSVNEGNSVDVTVTLSADPERTVTIPITITNQGGASSSDYSGVPATVTFNSGDMSKTFTFQATDDNDDDDSESVLLGFGNMPEDGVTAGSPNQATVSITDDDTAPTAVMLSLDPDSVVESAAATAVTVTASLNGSPLPSPTTVTVSRTGGTATPGTDYPAISDFTVTIQAGQTSATTTLSFDPTGDSLAEGDETVILTASAGGLSSGSATLTITDDDTAPTAVTLSLDPDSVGESAAATAVTVTASLNNSPLSTTTTVSVSRTGGTAIPGTDYPAISDFTVTIQAGQTSATTTLSFDPTQDSLAEGDETVVLTATAPGLSGDTATLTITDDDASPTAVSLSLDPDSVGESAAATAVTVTASLNGSPLSTTTTVTVSRTGGTAAPGTDYPAISDFTVTIQAGQTSATTTLSFDPTQDSLAEGDETVVLTATAPGLTPGAATLTITDDDTSGIVLSPTRITVTEEDATGTSYTVKLASQPSAGVTVTITGHAGTPLSLSRDMLTFTTTNWDTPQSVTVTAAHDDNAASELRTLTHSASGGDYAGVSNDLPVTVSDDDPQVTASFGQSSYSVDEGNSVDVTVTLSADPERTVTIPITITNQGGASSSDYSGVPATVNFNSGDTSQTISFQATDDTDDDDSESVLLGFGNMPEDGVTAGSPNQTTVSITDDDTAPTAVSLSLDPDSVGESAAATAVTVTASLNGSPLSTTTTVTVSRTGGTATPGTDYPAIIPFTVTIQAGQTSATTTLSFDPTGDSLAEGNETVVLTATAPGLSSGTATLTITDDDAAPTAVMLSLDPSSVGESAAATDVTVTASLNGSPLSTTTTVSVGRTGGTATPGTDYPAISDFTVTIQAGSTSGTTTLSFDPTADNLAEGNETVVLTATAPGLSGDTATLIITDDDAAPTAVSLSLDPDSVGESAAATEVTVTASLNNSPLPSATTVSVSRTGGTATPGTDYPAISDFTVTIQAGSTSGTTTLSFDPTGDSLAEGNETVVLTGTAPGLSGDTATLTITDDDAAPTAVMLSLDPDSVGESAAATAVTVTAALDNSPLPTPTTITVNRTGGTATPGTDYPAISDFTVTIQAGQTSGTTTLSFDPTGDSLAEGNETVVLTATAPGLSGDNATLTITDDDAAPTAVMLSLDPSSVGESAAATEVTVTASLNGSPLSTTTTVSVSRTGGTAIPGTDYPAISDFTVTIQAGQTSGTTTLSFDPTGDSLHEGNETVVLTATAPSLSPGAATLTITDDDVAPTAVSLSLSPDSVGESDAETEVTVTAALNNSPLPSPTTVSVSRTGGTATPGTDYPTISDFTVTIPAGQSSGTTTLSFNPTQDSLAEGSETVVLTASAAGLTPGMATLTITDDGATPTAVSLSLDPDSVVESAAATDVTVTASLNGSPLSTTTTVSVSRTGGTAIPGTDHAAISDFTVTIPAGRTSATTTLSFDPTADNLAEGNETVILTASAPGLSSGTATLTITDDEAVPTAVMLSLDPDSVGESAAATDVTVTASLNGSPLSTTTTVSVSRTGGTATPGTDYPAISDFTVTIQAGRTSGTTTLSFDPTGDSLAEGNETVVLTASAPGLTPDTATLTIADDDTSGIVFSPTRITVTEDSATGTSYTVKLATQPSAGVTVTITGHAGTPLSLSRDTLTFTTTSWGTTQSVTATAAHDDNAFNENITLTHSASGGDYAGVSNDLPVTVSDDDPQVTVSFGQSSYSVDEGSSVDVTVSLSADPKRTVVIPITTSNQGGASSSDYSGVPATVTFYSGDTSQTIIFQATDDTDDDDSESVVLGFGTMPETGVTAGPTNQATVNITDDTPTIPRQERPTVSLRATPAVIQAPGGERPSTTTVTALMDRPSGAETTVTISTSPSSATWMSLSANRELVIPAGASTSTGVVTIAALSNGGLAGHRVITVEGASQNVEQVNGPAPIRVTVLASELDVIPYPENGTKAVTGFTSTDPEVGLPGEGIDWDLTGVDADDFLIDPRGLLIFRRPPDYEAPTDREHNAVILNDNGSTNDSGERVGSTPANNLYRITVRATEQRTGGDGHRALVSESDFTIMVTNVNESPEVKMNRLQPEVGTLITAMLSDPDGEIDTDGTVGDGKDEVTLGWRWYTSKVQDPVASVDSHWAVATGEGSDSATYTPAGVRIDGTASDIVDEGRYLRAIVTYLDMGVSDTDDGVTTSMVRRATGVSAHPVRAEVSTDLDGSASTENGSPGFSPSADYTRTVSELAPVGAPVGDPVVAVDPDEDILTYELDDDTDADAPDTSGDVGYFTIDMATGQLEVAMSLSYEDHLDGYEFYVRATDPSGESATVMVTVIAEDENDPPVIMGSSAGGDAASFPRAPTELRVYEMDEDDRDAFDGSNDMMMIGMPGSGIGGSNVFTAIDEDLRDQVTWEIEGEDVEHFVLSSSGLSGPGQPIALLFREPPGYEAPADSNMDNVYKVTLIARDSDGSVAARPLSVFVDNVDERGEAVFLEEQPLIGTPIGVSVDDPDTYQALVTWQWMRAPTTESEFSVIPGATASTYTPVEDDGGHYLRAYATYIDSTSHSDDPDTYDIDERTHKMNGTGYAAPREATMMDGSETDSDRLYRVMATSDYAVRADPDGSANDSSGTPAFHSQGLERSVSENAESGTIVGDPVSVVTGLGDSTFRYNLEDTPTGDDRYFTIDEDSGQIRVGGVAFPPQVDIDVSPVPDGATAPDTADPVLDHEDNDTFTLVVTAVDTEDSSRSAVTTVTVSLVDLNERPYFDLASRNAVADPIMYGERRGNEIIHLAAVEPDGDELHWELSGPDADHLMVVDAEDSGGGRDRVALEFRARPDYENGAGSATSTGGRPGDTYLVTLRATETSSVGDGPLMAAELPVRVQVVNADEPGRADFSLLQPEVGTPITATTTDADGVVGPVTYTWYRAKVTEPHRDVGPDHDLTGEWVQLSEGTSGTGGMTYTPQGVLRADDGTTTGSELDEGRYLLAIASYVDGTGATTTAFGMTAHPVRADVSDAINNSPAFSVSETAREVPEDTAVGMPVGAPVQVATVEDGEVLTYSLDDDADAGNSLDANTDLRFFSIDRATGQVMVRMPLSAEATDGRSYTGDEASTAGEYAVYVRATNSSGDSDGEDSDVIRVVITATDVNEVPTISGSAELSVSEFDSTNDDHYVGLGNTEDDDGSVTLNATTTNLYRAVEEDRDNIVTWTTPIAGPDGALFEYSTGNGGRRLHFINPPDFEDPGDANRDNVYEVTLVVAGSEGETAEKSVRITVLNVDEAGTLTLLPEQPIEGSPVTAVLTDPDGVVSITDWEWFATSTSARAGAVRVSGASASEYTGSVGNFIWARVSYRDGASVEDDPVTALDERNDNPATDAVIEQHRLQYLDDGGVLDTTDTMFHNSDEVSESGTEYAVQVAPTPGVQQATSAGRVEVLEVAVPENTPSTGYVGVPLPGIGPIGAIQGIDAGRFVLAEDMDDNGSAYYDSILAPLVDDEDDKVGQLAVAAVTNFDYEDSKNTYTIEVVNPDPQAEVSMYKVTIMVMDVNEPPTPPREYRGLLAQNTAPDFGATSTTRMVAEDAAPGTNIGDPVVATDVDRGDQEKLVYTLGGPDAESFAIDPDTGQLMTEAALDLEEDDEYIVEVAATDDDGASATITVTIAVTAIDDSG